MAKNRLPWNHPALRISVASGRSSSAVEVNRAANLRLVCLSAAQRVIDRKKVPLRQPVLPLHKQPFATARFEDRPRAASVETPQTCRRKIAMRLLVQLFDSHPIEWQRLR